MSWSHSGLSCPLSDHMSHSEYNRLRFKTPPSPKYVHGSKPVDVIHSAQLGKCRAPDSYIFQFDTPASDLDVHACALDKSVHTLSPKKGRSRFARFPAVVCTAVFVERSTSQSNGIRSLRIGDCITERKYVSQEADHRKMKLKDFYVPPFWIVR